MSLTGKIEAEVEIEAPAEEFYKIWKSQCFHVATASPGNIQGVEVHEGDWETVGSVKVWNYTIEGRAETVKEKVEVDDDNMAVTFHFFEGDVFKDFKSFSPTFKVAPKEGGSGSLVKASIEYEKRNDVVRVPNAYLDVMVSMAKDVSAHIIKA